MFRQIAGLIDSDLETSANLLFKKHPMDLTLMLEEVWNHKDVSDDAVIEPNTLNSLPLLDHLLTELSSGIPYLAQPGDGFMWDHLIYAYMIENTRVYEIFRRVIQEYLYDEKLGIPTADVQKWVRNTEELFYRDPPPFYITSVTSHIRSDMRASRRNAYHRMFGMDLNHGTDDNKPYPYTRADASNREFITIFEDFLREVWIGIMNISNISGAKPTDDGKLANLAENLYNMMSTRRIYGNLSREEFVYVSMMSWFHLTLEFDSPIVRDLKAEAASPEQRLFKIAQRVRMPAHGLSKSYFDISDPISQVMRAIESNRFNTTATVQNFYDPGLGDLSTAMNTVITHWSLITGRDMKARKVAAT
jgi:hypothetical protein